MHAYIPAASTCKNLRLSAASGNTACAIPCHGRTTEERDSRHRSAFVPSVNPTSSRSGGSGARSDLPTSKQTSLCNLTRISPSYSIASTMTVTPQMETALAVVQAFDRLDIDAILSYRAPECTRHILPSTLGYPPVDNTRYATTLNQLKPIFRNFRLTVDDVVEDREARRICMWLMARADTAAGEYVNEYVWTLDFDASGTKITRVKEFVDTLMTRDFWPKLQKAMDDQKAEAAT